MHVKRTVRKNRKSAFGVQWKAVGEKEYKSRFFETEALRDTFYQSMKKKALHEGNAVLNLSASDAIILKRALDSANGDALTVLKAVDRWNEFDTVKAVPLRDAIKQFIDEQYNLGKNDNWIGHNKKYLSRLVEFTEKSNVRDITTDIAQQWIFQLNFAPVTVKNHATGSRVFFNWCKKRRLCHENPFDNVSTPPVIQGEPEFLTIEQSKILLCIAVQHYPDAIAHLALQFFAGVRASACAGIGLKNINFEEKGFRITAQNAKNNTQVYIDGHPDALWMWLNFAKKNYLDGFSMNARTHRQRYSQVIKKAGFQPPRNALRHTFATYHVAYCGDAGKTATLLTHRSDRAIIYTHYKGNTTRSEAEKYFALTPDNVLK